MHHQIVYIIPYTFPVHFFQTSKGDFFTIATHDLQNYFEFLFMSVISRLIVIINVRPNSVMFLIIILFTIIVSQYRVKAFNS